MNIKKSIMALMMTVGWMSVNAAIPERKMLEQGKMWAYLCHHFEDTDIPEGSTAQYWMVYYTLEGDTIINGLQYMKMYRYDEHDGRKKYYGAFREDEEGRVWAYEHHNYANDNAEYMIIDFNLDNLWLNYSMHVDGGGPLGIDTTIVETIKEDGKLFHRYRYAKNRSDIHSIFIGIEGVGFKKTGLVHSIFEPLPNYICDYEELSFVYANDFSFSASAFDAPKEIELTDGERQLISSNNDFAFNLFRKARGEGSTVLSPLSITYALGMMKNGADGQTLQEINQTLGFGEASADAINAFCQKMLIEANTLDDKTKSLIANTIFVNEGLGYSLQNDFVQKANDYYSTQPQNRDFTDGETMNVINQWASDHTEGMIPEVLNKYTFKPSAVSYLLNALYFKGIWSIPFDVAETKEESFDDGPSVPMMHKLDVELEYTENDLYQAVNLFYGNGAYRMSIFLPREDKTVGDVLDALNGSNWLVKGYPKEVDLKLPRFETNSNIGLVDVMSALGMPTAFTDYAEFPYFCNVPIFISNMFQVAKIKLDEEGTEAAAVTVIETSESATPPDPRKFHATRPFLYVISEQSTGAVFFIGQYMGKVSTGVTSPRILRQTDESAIYNLTGQKVKASNKGIIIQNGKKIVVK